MLHGNFLVHGYFNVFFMGIPMVGLTCVHFFYCGTPKNSVNLYNDIMDQHNSPGIFKIIKRVLTSRSTQQPLLIDGRLVEDPLEQLNAWTGYYTDLYTPDSEGFDPSFLENAENLNNILTEFMHSCKVHTPVSEKEVFDAIKSLNRGKCCDEIGMVAEHLIHAIDVIVPPLTAIFEKATQSLYIPSSFKSGVISNVPKKGKNLLMLPNYRGITVTILLGKVMETIIENRKREVQRMVQSDMQFGFTTGLAPSMASLLLKEYITDAKESGRSIYVMTLDAWKAFDVVSHPVLMNSLFCRGSLQKRTCSSLNGTMFFQVKSDGKMNSVKISQ